MTGFRDRDGELTVRVASGEAGRWSGLTRVIVAEGRETRPGAGQVFDVERSRAYRDRLVLKLRGVEDSGAADALRGRLILAPADQVPALPQGVHYAARLVGLDVRDEDGRLLGHVTDVTGTGGADLLVVEDVGGGELLIPFVREIVVEVLEAEGRITVRTPEGLLAINQGRRPVHGRQRKRP